METGSEDDNKKKFRDDDGRPEEFKKLRTKHKSPMTIEERDSHFFVNAYLIAFMVFYFTRSYAVGYDSMLFTPFCVVALAFMSKTMMSIILFFIFLYGTVSQFVTWNLW